VTFRKMLALAAAIATLPLAANAAAVDFTDTFTGGVASSHWNNATGAWTAAGDVYNASLPNNSPLTISALDYDFLGSSLLTFDVDVNSMGDGGLWFSGDGTNQNGILLVLGGNGYGPSGGSHDGDDIYWHQVVGGSVGGAQNQASSVFTPGRNYHLTVTVLNGVYSAYIDNSAVAATSLNSNQFSHGRVGLYDEWAATSFDNVHVTGEVAGVPEPANWALMIAGFGLAGATLRRRRAIAA